MPNYRHRETLRYNDPTPDSDKGIGKEHIEIEKEIRRKRKHDNNDKRHEDNKYTKRRQIEWERDDRSERSSRNYRSDLHTPEVRSLSSARWEEDDDDVNKFAKPAIPRRERFTPQIHRLNEPRSDKRFNDRTPAISSVRSTSTKGSPDECNNDLDENWYALEDGVEHNPFINVSDELTMKKKQQIQEGKSNRFQNRKSAYAMEREETGKLWENNQLLSSGAYTKGKFDLNIDNEDSGQNIIHLHVHNIMPPFLDGRIVFTKQFEPVIPVKDDNCEMAKIAKNGSAMVKYFRDMKEKAKMQKKTANLAGTALGNLMGIQNVDKVDNWSEANYKDSLKYSDKMNQIEVTDDMKLKIDKQRKNLPIFRVRSQLLRLIRENQIMVIVGETGSGKTTQLTQYLLEEGYHNRGIIGCTQPRRVAAVSVAKRVADEVGTKLGDRVGYSIRFEDCKSDNTVIKYMTDGILLRESLRDSDLDGYSVIIMDEAHERTLNTDILFGILKEIVQRRSNLHLIVTSATMDADKFSRFFGGCGIFNIPGRTFPVDVKYEKSSILDPVAAAVNKAVDTHLGSEPDSGDILVFMSGQEDVEVTCSKIRETLEELKEKNPPELKVEPLYSQLSSERQSDVFRVEKGGPRRCIVATNIAETSVTLDGIRYVIDNGYCKMKVFNSRVGMDSLQIYPISQASANQRSGRAGRTGPGVCYRLYTINQYENDMLSMTVPEIQRTNLTNVVLLLKSLHVQDLMSFNFMDSPPHDNILNSMYQLWMLGALDSTGALTDLGRRMAEFPLEPSLSKMLITSVERNCSDEMLTIVSMLSVPAIFSRPMGHQEEADTAHERFQVAQSDHLTLLNVYRLWRSAGYSSSWCKRHFVHYKSLKRVREVRQQLKEIMDKLEMALRSTDNETELRYCICSAYFSQACKWKGVGEYVNLRSGVVCHLHPTSALYNMAFSADYVVYHELLMTSREYMNYVTHVEPDWLAELGYMFYSVKQKGESAISRQLKEQQTVQRMELEMQRRVETERRGGDSVRAAADLKRDRECQSARVASYDTPRSSRHGL